MSKAGVSCPKCESSMLRERTGELTCFSCGYEHIESVPIGQNPMYINNHDDPNVIKIKQRKRDASLRYNWDPDDYEW